jgi:hypothetical protein
MFGNNENQMEKLVKKHQWDKAGKKLRDADTESKIAFAAACGGSSDEEAINFLIELIKDDDEKVQIQAVKSMGVNKSQIAKTHLQWLSDRIPAEKNGLKAEIKKTIELINNEK